MCMLACRLSEAAARGGDIHPDADVDTFLWNLTRICTAFLSFRVCRPHADISNVRFPHSSRCFDHLLTSAPVTLAESSFRHDRFHLIAGFLKQLREVEAKGDIHPDPDVDAYLKASAVEGMRKSPVTQYMIRILGLEVRSEQFLLTQWSQHSWQPSLT